MSSINDKYYGKPYIVKPKSWREEGKYFDALGIKIIPSPPCGTYVDLPDGWTFNTESGWIAESTTIYDDKGRRRIYSVHYFPTKRYVHDDSLTVWARYNVRKLEVKGVDGALQHNVVVTDFADMSDIFSAGIVDWRDDKPLVEKCEAYLNEHYPDWKNPLAYWN